MKIAEMTETTQQVYHALDIALSRMIYLADDIKDNIKLIEEYKKSTASSDVSDLLEMIDSDIKQLRMAADIIKVGLSPNLGHEKHRILIKNTIDSVINSRAKLNNDGITEGDNPNFFGGAGQGSQSAIPGTPEDLTDTRTPEKKRKDAIKSAKKERGLQKWMGHHVK